MYIHIYIWIIYSMKVVVASGRISCLTSFLRTGYFPCFSCVGHVLYGGSGQLQNVHFFYWVPWRLSVFKHPRWVVSFIISFRIINSIYIYRPFVSIYVWPKTMSLYIIYLLSFSTVVRGALPVPGAFPARAPWSWTPAGWFGAKWRSGVLRALVFAAK